MSILKFLNINLRILELREEDKMEIATAIKIAKLAVDNLANEESRKKTLLVIFIPIFFLLFLLSMLAYLVTSPIAAITNAIGSSDTDFIENIIRFKEIAEVSDYEENFATATNIDYSYNSTTNYNSYNIVQGETTVVYYNQGDKPWNSMLYGTLKTIAQSGCGPTSMAIVISTFTGQDITPQITSNWSYKNGYLVEGYSNGRPYAMSSHALIPALAKEYGLSCEGVPKGTDTKDKIRKALSEGKLIVAIMGPGHFTSGGHFMVLRGITKDGKILVADCASRSRTDKEWDLSLIVNEARNGAGAGGPFWVISK